ncbi:hypothetical protein ACFYPN_25195 [Streptomyces sp. NPDC005576]|uniref:hypothetical protein n=1 Tax=unclassified Streptomyces TaxID=2593676 RepID=UPI0033FD7998
MRRRKRSTGMLVASLSVAMALTAISASATSRSSYVVTPGGAFSGHSDGTLSWPMMALYCSATDVAGSLVPNPPGSVIGTVNTVAIGGCNLAGLTFTFTLTSGARPLSATGAVAGRPHWVGVSVSGLAFRMTGIGCTASFGGNLSGHYENDTGRLVIDGSTMKVSAANCLGLLQAGDPTHLDAGYAISPHQTIQVS